MFKAIWSFLWKPEVFIAVMRVVVAVLATAAVDGAFDDVLPASLHWMVDLAYPVNALVAAHGGQSLIPRRNTTA